MVDNPRAASPTGPSITLLRRPPRIAALNTFLPQGLLRWRLSSAEALEATAIRSTDHCAELTDNSRKALRELLRSYRAQAQLHPLGEIMAAANVLSLLKHQLRLNAAIAKDPAVMQRPVRAPLVITGLPRTGSTLLHNLLAIDPQWRVPLSWETTQPAPIAASKRARRLRIAQTQARFSLIELINPGFKAIHELDANLPQECLVITAAELRSHLFFSASFVPDYQDWLDDQTASDSYTHHRRFLQYLQGSGTGSIAKSWALKAPSHLFSIEGLLESYPDVRLVHTHRDPAEVLGSIASLQWHLYQTFSHFDDPRALGKQLCDRWGVAQKQFSARLRASVQLRRNTFLLDYHRLMQDPIEQVDALYRFFNLQLSPSVADAMRHYLNTRPRHYFGKHRYNLADYGLTAAEVRGAFEAA